MGKGRKGGEARGRGREEGRKGKGGDPKGWFTPPPMFEILKNTLYPMTTLIICKCKRSSHVNSQC